jgi:hypothetical protein
MSEPPCYNEATQAEWARMLVQDSKLSQHTCNVTTESWESREVAASQLSLRIDTLQNFSRSNRLELPLQTVHIASMAHFSGQVYTSYSPNIPLQISPFLALIDFSTCFRLSFASQICMLLYETIRFP